MNNGKFTILFQKFVNMLEIVERIVDEKVIQLGDDTQLVVHAGTQFVAYALLAGVDILHYLFAAL